MVQYIYFVKCPNCEDEHFDFFDEAKAFALGCMSQKPIITQTEVCRNDFGECTDSADLGTVWSWEDVMKETEAEPTISVFTKDDLKLMADGQDPEFDSLDNSVDCKAEEPILDEWVTTSGQETAKQYIIKVSNNSDGYNYEGNGGRSLVRIDSDALSIFSSLADAEASLAGYKKGSKAKIVELADELRRKPIPEGMTIEQLVEEMEENEDTVECAWCEELFDKSDCRYEVGAGGPDDGLGWLCSRCEMAIKSRGETLTFRENNYWDFLDEDLDTASFSDIVADSINHLVNELGKDPAADDFVDDVIKDIENNYDVDFPDDPEGYRGWASEISSEVSRQLNNQLDEDLEWHTYKITYSTKANPDKEQTTIFKTWKFDVEYAWRMSRENVPHSTIKRIELLEDYNEPEAVHDLGNEYDGGYPDTEPELLEPDSPVDETSEISDSHLTLCPECGEDTFDTETGICVTCGFN